MELLKTQLESTLCTAKVSERLRRDAVISSIEATFSPRGRVTFQGLKPPISWQRETWRRCCATERSSSAWEKSVSRSTTAASPVTICVTYFSPVRLLLVALRLGSRFLSLSAFVALSHPEPSVTTHTNTTLLIKIKIRQMVRQMVMVRVGQRAEQASRC